MHLGISHREERLDSGFSPDLFYYKFIIHKLSLILCISLLFKANGH